MAITIILQMSKEVLFVLFNAAFLIDYFQSLIGRVGLGPKRRCALKRDRFGPGPGRLGTSSN